MEVTPAVLPIILSLKNLLLPKTKSETSFWCSPPSHTGSQLPVQGHSFPSTPCLGPSLYSHKITRELDMPRGLAHIPSPAPCSHIYILPILQARPPQSSLWAHSHFQLEMIVLPPKFHSAARSHAALGRLVLASPQDGDLYLCLLFVTRLQTLKSITSLLHRLINRDMTLYLRSYVFLI